VEILNYHMTKQIVPSCGKPRFLSRSNPSTQVLLCITIRSKDEQNNGKGPLQPPHSQSTCESRLNLREEPSRRRKTWILGAIQTNLTPPSSSSDRGFKTLEKRRKKVGTCCRERKWIVRQAKSQNAQNNY